MKTITEICDDLAANSHSLLWAIKYTKAMTGLGLKASKAICDKYVVYDDETYRHRFTNIDLFAKELYSLQSIWLYI